MIPFLHLGPLTIPTFGLMVAIALLVSAYVLQADFNRRRAQLERLPGYKTQTDEGFLIIGVAGLVGLLGARLYHVLEDPHELFAHPADLLLSRFGFAWFGGFLGGLLALIALAYRLKIPLLFFLDICSPAACVGYAIGRIGCLLSGDGDYGKPTSWPSPWGLSLPHGVVPTTETCIQQGWPADCRVYPTPIYEFVIWMLIAWFLWRLGARALQAVNAQPSANPERAAKPAKFQGTTLLPRNTGQIFVNYLIWTGVARFLIEFIRINPRSFFGLSNAQTASLASILVGVIVFWRAKTKNRAQA
jgi:phosphatidylglycerol---prolipoprotein diacylglyceryl transferase